MTLSLRAMRARDVPRGMDLVRMAGWNQTEADWRMMLSMGEGHGVEDETGRLVASSMVLPYAPGVGWIGMVLVDESVRRRGLATTLLRNAIDRIEATGSSAMLDATPAGREVYLKLGFRDVGGIGRWRSNGKSAALRSQQSSLDMSDAAAESGIDADAMAFGATRRHLLENLRSRMGATTLALPSANGWLWSRAGRTATQIGPIVAMHEDDTLMLCDLALERIDGPVLLDVPDQQTELVAFLRARGFKLERSLTRMARGGAPFPMDGSMRAIAGPELG
jgi:GNAT superfamily N-acetyltransferase